MKRVLLVDDDALIRQVYRAGLEQQGFQVETVGDGLEATKALREGHPDIMVLDLMMPKLTGVDVLRFVRSRPELAQLPVIVLSNSYMDRLSDEAAGLGVEKALLKIRSTPVILAGIIKAVLAGTATGEDSSQLLAAARTDPAPPAPLAALPPQSQTDRFSLPASAHPAAPPEASGSVDDSEFIARVRENFLGQARVTCASLRTLFQNFKSASNERDRAMRLEDFYRKVHFLTTNAGLAMCHDLAQMGSVFEAMLFELMGKPDRVDASILRTAALSLDILDLLFRHAQETPDAERGATALVVDDDPLSNRVVGSALRRAGLQVRSVEDPMVGLELLAQKRFDLVLLDVEMPGMSGFDLCERLRELPGYENTPVIYVTSHSDFESRTRSVLSGGDDLIAKPIFPMELAVKAVGHLLRCRVEK